MENSHNNGIKGDGKKPRRTVQPLCTIHKKGPGVPRLHEMDMSIWEGARNAVQVCMNVQSQDRVHIISDEANRLIGEALQEASQMTGAAVHLVTLEQFGTRPLTHCPAELLDDILAFRCTVTLYTAAAQQGEYKMRQELLKKRTLMYQLLHLPQPRHAYMGDVSAPIMREGMRADYMQVCELTRQVFEIVKDAEVIQASSKKGSRLTIRFDRALNWVPVFGFIHQPGMFSNLPDGEVFTSPARVDGIVVADVLGDYFKGVMKDPVTFEISDSRIVRIDCANKALAGEVKDYIDYSHNGQRVGEFGIGTNTAVKQLIGNMIQDEKMPGFHLAFGSPNGFYTGAAWTSDVHLDVVPACCSIEVNGRIVMEDGEFLI